jgi:hypothetical protein
MHIRLLDQISSVHDCCCDNETGNLGSRIECLSSSTDSSEHSGYTLDSTVRMSLCHLVHPDLLTIVVEISTIQYVKKALVVVVRPTRK